MNRVQAAIGELDEHSRRAAAATASDDAPHFGDQESLLRWESEGGAVGYAAASGMPTETIRSSSVRP
jgi:hypothetical protein